MMSRILPLSNQLPENFLSLAEKIFQDLLFKMEDDPVTLHCGEVTSFEPFARMKKL